MGAVATTDAIDSPPAPPDEPQQETDVNPLAHDPLALRGGGPSRPADETAGDRSLFQILWRRRRVVGGAMALPVVLGLLYLLVARRTYTAEASLFIEAAGGHKIDDPNEQSQFLNTQKQVITSIPVLASALGEPGLMDLRTFAGKRDTISALRDALAVDVGTKDDLVTVSLESPYPDEATQLVKTVVESYTHFQVTQRKALTSDTLNSLTAEKTQTDKEIADTTAALQAYSLQHRVFGLDSQTSSDNDALKSIAASLTQAHLAAIAATARLADVPAPAGVKDGTALPDASYSSEDEAAVRQQLVQATGTLDALSAKYPQNSPTVMAAKAHVDQLTRQRYTILQSVKRAAVKQEADLEAYYESELKRSIDQRAFAVEYARMDDERKRLQERADAIDTRLRDLKVNDEGKMADVSVLEPAHADPLPTGPKKLRVLGLALAAGMLLGLVSAVVWDQFDTRFKSLAEIDRWLGLSALGVLPSVPETGSQRRQALYTYSEPNSAFAHACRGIWSALNAIGRDKLPRTLAVTSPSRGDGRTTVACGLAIAMSQYGRRVLLIDADVQSPHLADLLGVDGGTGLADAMAAATVDSDLLARCTRGTICRTCTS